MSGWQGFTVLDPVCLDCGAHLEPWTGSLDFGDPRDERERELAGNALAVQTHMHAEHRVEPAVGDLVQYAMPWRGNVLISDVYRVSSIQPDYDFRDFARRMRGDDIEPMLGTSYTLTNPTRSNDRCFPFFGDPARPLTFQMVETAPPVQGDLLDLIGWDFEGQDEA